MDEPTAVRTKGRELQGSVMQQLSEVSMLVIGTENRTERSSLPEIAGGTDTTEASGVHEDSSTQ